MKKLLFLTLIVCAVISTNTYAQAGDPQPQSMLQQMKEKQKPGLVEKAGLTEAQAEKVIELNYEMRSADNVQLIAIRLSSAFPKRVVQRTTFILKYKVTLR